MTGNILLFDFDSETSRSSWRIVDDGVMGGRSQGSFVIDKDGFGVFSGEVSLENNGGFSSLRHSLSDVDCSGFEKFILRVKGDGKKFQFRVKSSRTDYHSYIYEFKTSGEWEEIEIPFDQMYPGFRGRKLNMPNYPGNEASEIAFLIGNKKPESFKLLIDHIKIVN
ncbi:MAG: CIA30 family protein [Bacteroidota bacterium]